MYPSIVNLFIFIERADNIQENLIIIFSNWFGYDDLFFNKLILKCFSKRNIKWCNLTFFFKPRQEFREKSSTLIDSVLIRWVGKGHELSLTTCFEHISDQISSINCTFSFGRINKELRVSFFALLVNLHNLRVDVFIYFSIGIDPFSSDLHVISLKVGFDWFNFNGKVKIPKSLYDIVEWF